MTNIARIYRPARNAMQSGKARTRKWRLEFEPAAAKFIEPLMGWTGSRDTSGQVSIEFATLEAATAFCERHHMLYQVFAPHEPKRRIKAYADNFAFNRVG